MGKLTFHTRVEIGLATVLLLGSCGDGSGGLVTRDEVIDIADNSIDASGV